MAKRTFEASYLKELLSYDPETGEFAWRANTTNSRVAAGSIAGTVNRGGYRQISIKNSLYYAHRLAWLWVNGRWPTMVIDHVNGNRSDNRIANLREANARQNVANKRSTNRLGVRGVFLHEPAGRYTAAISRDNRTIYLGGFDSSEKAGAAYQAAAKKEFGEFAYQEKRNGNATE